MWKAGNYTAGWASGDEGVRVTSAPGVWGRVFVRNSGMELMARYWTGDAGWSEWENLGGTLTSSPTATGHGSRIDVFAVGMDPASGVLQTIMHKYHAE